MLNLGIESTQFLTNQSHPSSALKYQNRFIWIATNYGIDNYGRYDNPQAAEKRCRGFPSCSGRHKIHQGSRERRQGNRRGKIQDS